MLQSFWNKVTSFFKEAEELDLQSPQDISDIYEYLQTDTFTDIGNIEENEEPQYPSSLSEGDNLCEQRSGTVTELNNTYGFIDNKFYFDSSIFSAKLNVGQRVKFLAFRQSERHDWQVKKIYSVIDELWEGEQREANGDFEVRDSSERSIVCQVIERSGRNVLCSPDDIKFSLDNVRSDFTPCVGDWITLQALVEVNEEVTDLSGEILLIKEIFALRTKQKTGTVTILTPDSGGRIDDEIYFNKDSCEVGYVPRVGDIVDVYAIESEQGVSHWRALLIVPSEANQHNVKIDEDGKLDKLLQNKYGVVVTNNIKVDGLRLGEKREQEVVVENTGRYDQVLFHGKFHSKRASSQVTILSRGLESRTVLYPGQRISFYFLCHGKFVGHSTELLVFTFKGFQIGCKFEINVQSPHASLHHQNHDNNRRKVDVYSQQRNIHNERENISTFGSRPIKSAAITKGKIGFFVVPKKLWSIILDDHCPKRNLRQIEDDIAALVPCLNDELNVSNYKDKFHALLHLEEIAATLNMRRYDMDRACFRLAGPGGEYLALEVEGLVEKRPSLIVGDSVLAKSVCDDKSNHEGFIHRVLQREVWLKFHPSFHLSFGSNDYHITFQYGRSPIRKCHEAINQAFLRLGRDFLFPNRLTPKEPQVILEETEQNVYLPQREDMTQHRTRPNTSQLVKDIKNKKLCWFNRKLNFYQKEAVKNILKGEARPLPYIIFGPPGTGKTITLVETILQVLCCVPHSRILVATPSNSSSNLIAERLLDANVLRPGDLVRLVAYHCFTDDSIPERLLPYSTSADLTIDKKHYRMEEPLKRSSTAKMLGRHRVTIGTCIALGQLFAMGFPPGHFTHVLVDEAGQATEAEIMIPLSFLHSKTGQAVLAGDPLQLGPVVISTLAQRFGLGESFLSRIIHRFPYERDIVGFPTTMGFDPRLVTKLVVNYRSVPEILKLPNSMFYESELIPWVSPDSSPESELLRSLAPMLPVREDTELPPAVVFHGIRGENMQEGDCPSWYNPQEVVQVISYVTQLYNHGLVADNIGVITPYIRQVQKIRALMLELDIEQPKIGSVEEFQGQERSVIILSTVRSSVDYVKTDVRHSLGFVASPKRLNVAVTRAKSLLIVLGNPHLLGTDPHWRTVLEYSVSHGGYIGCDLPVEMDTLFLHDLPESEEGCL